MPHSLLWIGFNLIYSITTRTKRTFVYVYVCVCLCVFVCMYICAFVFLFFCSQLCLCLFKRGIVETHIVEKGWERLSSTSITEMCHNYIPFCIISLCIISLCIFDVGWFNTNTCFTTKLKFCNSQDSANSLQYSYFYSSL